MSEAEVRRQFGHDEDGMVREIARLRADLFAARQAVLTEGLENTRLRAALERIATSELPSFTEEGLTPWYVSIARAALAHTDTQETAPSRETE